MTTPPQMPRARRRNRLLVVGTLALVATAALVTASVACSTIEPTTFSDGVCVGGGCVQSGASSVASSGSAATSSSSSGAMMCTDASGCGVSWATDIYAGIFDTTSVGCTTNQSCHGSPASKGGITLNPGASGPSAASDGYNALSGYMLLANPGPVKPYITACDTTSGILCNMVVSDGDGGTVTTYGTCGSPMPLAGINQLSVAQLNTIAEWIQCGALNN